MTEESDEERQFEVTARMQMQLSTLAEKLGLSKELYDQLMWVGIDFMMLGGCVTTFGLHHGSSSSGDAPINTTMPTEGCFQLNAPAPLIGDVKIVTSLHFSQSRITIMITRSNSDNPLMTAESESGEVNVGWYLVRGGIPGTDTTARWLAREEAMRVFVEVVQYQYANAADQVNLDDIEWSHFQ